MTIHDLPKYQDYMAKIKPVIEAAGGRYLVLGGAHTAIEGAYPQCAIARTEELKR